MKKYLIILMLFSQVSRAQIKTISGSALPTTELESRIKRAMDSLHVTGMSLAVINNGKIVFNKGFGYADLSTRKVVTPSTFFEAASMSKPVFAAYVLKLAKAGKLDLDRPLFNYLPYPDIDDDRYKAITARMVLSHTSGLPNWRETEKMKLAFAPGTRFSYSGEGYLYLAKVIAHLKGRTLKDLDADFQQEIAIPFKLKDFHFVISPQAAKEQATGYQDGKAVKDERDRSSFDPAGGMYATSSNYATFLIALMNRRSAYRELFRPVISLAENDVIRRYFSVKAWTMGLGVIEVGGTENYWHGGNNLGYTNSMMIDPAKKFGYVFLTNADQCHGLKKVIEEILWR